MRNEVYSGARSVPLGSVLKGTLPYARYSKQYTWYIYNIIPFEIELFLHPRLYQVHIVLIPRRACPALFPPLFQSPIHTSEHIVPGTKHEYLAQKSLTPPQQLLDSSYNSNSTLLVRVSYQSATTVPCCIHLVLPPTRSTKHCHDAAINANSPTTEYEPKRPRNYPPQQKTYILLSQVLFFVAVPEL